MTKNREQCTLINNSRSDFPSGIQIVRKFLCKTQRLDCINKASFRVFGH